MSPFRRAVAGLVPVTTIVLAGLTIPLKTILLKTIPSGVVAGLVSATTSVLSAWRSASLKLGT
jgi:hypothetical protein